MSEEGKIIIRLDAGSGNTIEIEFDPGTTTATAMVSDIVKSVVDLGGRGTPIVNGVEVDENTVLQDGDELEVVSKGNKKGA